MILNTKLYVECRTVVCHYTGFHDLFIVMVNIVMLSVVKLNVVAPSKMLPWLRPVKFGDSIVKLLFLATDVASK
jgi:hypothetical protein